MKTHPIYLEDSYAKEMDATILDVFFDSEGKWRVILDKTVFYPMGGGQATDQGILKGNDLQATVYMVMMKDGEINHYLTSASEPRVGTPVQGTINWDRRYINMKKHSAGHIVDFAMYLLGYSPKTLVPFKGDHDKKLFIAYQGVIEEDIQEKLQLKVNELIEKNLHFSWEFKPLEVVEKEALYLQPGLPSNKPLRMLTLEGVGSVADGGTQLYTTGELEEVKIVSIESKEENTIITYAI